MKIQIIGVGVVGTAQACLFSNLGHEVFGYDPKGSVSEFYKTIKEPSSDVDLTFICTPETVVEGVVDDLVRRRVEGLYVIKSTVPPGTSQGLMDRHHIHICHNPEFLREEISLEDVLHPSAVVIGQCCPEHGNILQAMYTPLGCPLYITRPTVSEVAKLTINSYLATLITFWNEINILTTAMDISTDEVARIARSNPRVSSYGTAFFGAPFGGKCLPKDLEQLIRHFHKVGLTPKFLEQVKQFNRDLQSSP